MPQIPSPHLVVIDDDPDVRDLIVAFFRPRGYLVTAFDDAEAALKASQDNMKTWDVVLTDFQLPQMSGIEFIAAFKKIRPETPIILVTVLKSVETAVEAIEKGAYDFIVKPLHFPQLQVSVERALRLNSLTENIAELREQIKENGSRPATSIIGKSPNFTAALDVARRVANSAANIFIFGESGTGKEVVARLIHSESNRKRGPFIAINCSAIPENLLESELFGHAKGSFTGAHEKRAGLFEEADDGTIFLDEIGDMSLPLQAKLLRVLQEKKIKRVGENASRTINARVISATHKNISQEVLAGRFREDLFYRLNVIPIHLPALRERPEDIFPLAECFLKKFSLINNSCARSFSREAVRFMIENTWRGNVRELENAIERAVVMASGPEIRESDFLLSEFAASPEASRISTVLSANDSFESDLDFRVKYTGALAPLHEVVQRYIEYAVKKNAGARDKTAKDLGIDRKTLYKRMHLADRDMGSQLPN